MQEIKLATFSYHCLQCFNAVGWVAEGLPACKKLSGGMLAWLCVWVKVQIAQLMPLPFTISCSSKSRLLLPSWFYLSCAGSSG